MVGEDICHHGIKGQRWGVRRYQNKDGSLTAAGKKRYSDDIPITDVKVKDRVMVLEPKEVTELREKLISWSDYGEKQAASTLTKSQTKALNKVVRDQRVKKGEVLAGHILGGSLSGLTWSYLKDLGLI